MVGGAGRAGAEEGLHELERDVAGGVHAPRLEPLPEVCRRVAVRRSWVVDYSPTHHFSPAQVRQEITD